MQYTNFNLTAPGQPQYLNGVRVTPGLANSLGITKRPREPKLAGPLSEYEVYWATA